MFDIVFGIKVRMSGLCINRYWPIVIALTVHLYMPQKFYLHKILSYALVTFGKAWKCYTYYTHVMVWAIILPLTRCRKCTCAMYMRWVHIIMGAVNITY